MAAEQKVYTIEEVKKHNKKTDCWIIVRDGVYDVTPYLFKHPGGFSLVFKNAGEDATFDFEGMFHSRNAKVILEKYRIGSLKGRSYSSPNSLFPYARRAPVPKTSGRGTGPYGLGAPKKSGPYGLGAYQEEKRGIKFEPIDKKPLLRKPQKGIIIVKTTEKDPISERLRKETIFQETLLKLFPMDGQKFYPLYLIHKVPVTHDVSLFYFSPEKPSEESQSSKSPEYWKSENPLKLPPGFHLSIKANLNGEEVKRSYTPLSVSPEYIRVLMKVYEKGLMSSYLNKLKMGSQVEIRAPMTTRAVSSISKDLLHFEISDDWSSICMIAGGTGITPLYQYLHFGLKSQKSKSEKEVTERDYSLWSCNKTKEDILMKKELDELQESFSNRLRLCFNITSLSEEKEEEESNSFHLGRPTGESFQKFFPSPSPKVAVLVCGPIPFNEFVEKIMLSVGYTQIFLYS